MSVEKNFVDVSRLFNWGKLFEVKDNKGNILVNLYMRLVGDAEVNRSRVFALRKSAELRKKLNDPTSDESVAFIPEKESMDKDRLIEMVLVYSVRDLSKDANKDADLPYPHEPDSDAPLEEQEKYQEEVDTYPKRREELYRKNLDTLLEKKRKELSTQDSDKVYHEFRVRVINELCETEMMKRFNEMNVFFGTYLDEDYKKQAFKSFEQFENLPTEIKNKFTSFYTTLDIDSSELKK
jgi:hypothetical protein